MLRVILLLCFIFGNINSFGQEIIGRVVDGDNGRPLSFISVSNLSRSVTTYSDTNGVYHIAATAVDKLRFSFPSYQTVYLSGATAREAEDIKLRKREILLDEVEVISDIAKFKRDSTLNHTLYRKELGYATSRSKRKLLVKTGEIGVTYNGLLSEAALGISGKKKKYKRFAAALQQNEQESFIKLRYNPQVVESLTGMAKEKSADFILRHPMPYDFARESTELELKSWIMNAYKSERGK